MTEPCDKCWYCGRKNMPPAGVCPKCDADLTDPTKSRFADLNNYTRGSHLGHTQQRNAARSQDPSALEIFAWILLVVGAALLFVFLFLFGTSVDDINNIGLLFSKLIGVVSGFAIAFFGLVMLLWFHLMEYLRKK